MVKLFEKSDWYKITDPVEAMYKSKDMSVYDRGVGVTVFEGDRTLGCGGVVLHNDYVGELWLRLSQTTGSVTAMRGIIAGIEILKNSFKDVVLICRVKDGWRKGERLVQHLGFTKDHMEDNYWVYKCQTL